MTCSGYNHCLENAEFNFPVNLRYEKDLLFFSDGQIDAGVLCRFAQITSPIPSFVQPRSFAHSSLIRSF